MVPSCYCFSTSSVSVKPHDSITLHHITLCKSFIYLPTKLHYTTPHYIILHHVELQPLTKSCFHQKTLLYHYYYQYTIGINLLAYLRLRFRFRSIFICIWIYIYRNLRVHIYVCICIFVSIFVSVSSSGLGDILY